MSTVKQERESNKSEVTKRNKWSAVHRQFMRKAIGVDATHAKVGRRFAYSALAIFKKMQSSGIVALWYSDLITRRTTKRLVCKDRLHHHMSLSSMSQMGVHVLQDDLSHTVICIPVHGQCQPGTIHHPSCQGHAEPRFTSVKKLAQLSRTTKLHIC